MLKIKLLLLSKKEKTEISNLIFTLEKCEGQIRYYENLLSERVARHGNYTPEEEAMFGYKKHIKAYTDEQRQSRIRLRELGLY